MARHDDEAAQGGERLIDLARAALPGEPPVAGAQWDELHRRWETWDAVAEAWMIVGDDSGEPARPPAERLTPDFLARELLHADEAEAEVETPHILDVDRIVAPTQIVPGAQWNEVVGRWERWDELAEAWVEAVASG